VKVLVTGANGFIGSHLCEALLLAGHKVRAMVRETSDLTWLEGLDVEFAYADLRAIETLGPAVAGQDWVFHSAATLRPRSPAEYEKVNVTGTNALAEECARAGVKRFVLFSSVAAAGPAAGPDRPKAESEIPQPVSRYGRGKLAAEQALCAMADRLHSVTLRFSAVYGPREKDLLNMLKILRLGFTPDFGGTVSMLYVKDAVRAALLVAGSDVPSGSVYFVSDGCSHSYDEMGRAAAEFLGRRPVRLKIPRRALRAAARVSEWFSREGSILNRDKATELTQGCWVCSHAKAGKEFGYEPEYSFRDGIGETVRWYQERGWL